MTTKKAYFGTDGIRGKVGEYPITPDFVLHLGWAIGHCLNQQFPFEKNIVVIGKDTRISGYMFESAMQAGLVAAGARVKLLGPMPTPAIAYLTRTLRAKIGVVISASHNPYFDNGIKFFNETGTKLSDEAEFAIETALKLPIETVSSESIGKVTRIDDAAGRYIEYCKSTVGQGFSLAGKKIVLDCANGATYYVAEKVFKELDAKVETLGVSPNGLNINQDVGSTSPRQLQQRVKAVQADLGIAFDGDGDRVVFVDKDANVIDGDQLIYVIAAAMDPEEPSSKGVVGTLMTNMGVEMALKSKGFDFVRAKVGDRYVKEAMIERGWQLGGESSGHIICNDVSTTGDGIVSALKVLSALKQLKLSLTEVLASLTLFPQQMKNVRVTDQASVINDDRIKEAVASAEVELADEGRVLLRPSGTEPLVRVMVEAKDEAKVTHFVDALSDVVKHVAAS